MAFWWSAWHCAHLTISLRRVRRELDVPVMSGNRFRTRTHALDALTTFPYRFDNFYFRSRNHDFRKFPKILVNQWKSLKIHRFWLRSPIQGGCPLVAREEREELERRRDRCAGAPQASQRPETCQECRQWYPYRFLWRLEGLNRNFPRVVKNWVFLN